MTNPFPKSKAERQAWVRTPEGQVWLERKIAEKQSTPKVAMYEGAPCRKCGALLIRRKTKERPGRRMGYAWYLYCPRCGTMYHRPEAIFVIGSNESKFGPIKPLPPTGPSDCETCLHGIGRHCDGQERDGQCVYYAAAKEMCEL